MEKETALTNRQEKLLKTAIVRALTDKAQKYLNDKGVVEMFPMIADMAEKIVTEFNETNLVDKANEGIREDLEKEKFPQECTN
jgi:hypothetical protein